MTVLYVLYSLDSGVAVHTFKKLAAMPTAKDFVDIELSKTQRQTPTVVHTQYAIGRNRSGGNRDPSHGLVLQEARLPQQLALPAAARGRVSQLHFSIQVQFLRRIVKRFRGGLAFKAHRL